jgi:hypothetical protein
MRWTCHLPWLRPQVPFNLTQFADYIEGIRDLTHNTYDQFLDFREVSRGI